MLFYVNASYSVCVFYVNHFVSVFYVNAIAELSKIVGPIGPSDKILTRSDLNYFASDPMSGASFQ